MRRVLVRSLQPGTILGKTLYNERGDTLLPRGTTLTPRYVGLLLQQKFRYVYVEDPGVDDVIGEDIVSEYVHGHALKTMHRFLDIVERASRRTRLAASVASTSQLGRALQAGDFQKATLDTGIHETLTTVVASIIDETIDAPTLSGLTAIKTHDNYTFCHSVDVAITAIMIGRKLFLDREALRHLALGCMLHDIGKILIEPAILNKPGPLTAAEFTQMKKHPAFGYHMLRSLQPEETVANNIAYEHHERQDGRGYPRGLRGTNRIAREALPDPRRIPFMCEIAAVADVYDALTADRPYRPAFAPDRIIDIIKDMTGPALNREVVAHFFSVLPVYPLGIEIMVKNGRYRQWRGVVARLNDRVIDRPVIRLFQDERGRRVGGIEVDLARDRDVDIAIALT